jgi:hypothetical protein
VFSWSRQVSDARVVISQIRRILPPVHHPSTDFGRVECLNGSH